VAARAEHGLKIDDKLATERITAQVVASVQDARRRLADDAPTMNTHFASRGGAIAIGRASRLPLARMRAAFAVLAARLRTHWQHLMLDERGRYLSGAADLADLERRLRALDRSRDTDARWLSAVTTPPQAP
jgi:hypothetical protein